MYIRVHDVFGQHYGPYLRAAGMIERGERMRVYVSANGRDMLRGSGGVFWVAALCLVTCEPKWVQKKGHSLSSGGTTRCFHWPGDLVRVQLAFSFQLEYRVEDALKLAIGDIKSFFTTIEKLGPKF
jgi:hypothetical protein